MLLVLLSGGGLIAFAVVDLWAAVRDADEVLAQEARREAERIAAALDEALSRPGCLDACPDTSRFEVRDGAVALPAEFSFLGRAPFSETTLPLPVRIQLEAARRQEFVQRDRAKAQQRFETALKVEGLSPDGRRYLHLLAAWHAERNDDRQRALAHFREVVADPLEIDPSTSGSTCLLASRLEPHDSELTRRLAARARWLPEEGREALGLGAPDPADVARLQTLRTLVESRAALDHASAFSWEDREWIVLRDGTHGALVALASLLERPPIHAPGLRLADDHTPADAPRALNGTLAVLPGPPVSSFWRHPAVLLALLVLLALCFGGGLILSFRALFRERAAMRTRAEFLTSVTHELKTPLSSIRLLSEMLEENRVRDREKQREYYRLLAGESARLTVLIENVLDLGRMERGERAYDLRPNDLDEIVAETVKVFGPIANRDGLELDVDLEPGDHVARCDHGALVQAFLNVLDNARKYAADGRRIEVRGQQQDDRYDLRVRDFGPGIPAEQREAIFEQFRRGAEQQNGAVAGVGLGLYLARTILHAHDGDLVCVAPDGPGTEFRFTLPLRAS